MIQKLKMGFGLLFLLSFTTLSAQKNKYEGMAPEEIAKWDHTIEVDAGEEKFDGESFYAYSIDVFDAKKSFVESRLVEEVRERTDEKKVKKNIVSGLKVGLPSLKEEDIDVRAKVEDGRGGNAKVFVAFLDEGKAINPSDFPDGDKAARDIMHKLSVILNQGVVQTELDDASEYLADLESDLLKMTKGAEKLESDVEKQQDKSMKAKKDEANTTKKLADEKSKLTKMEIKYGSNPGYKETKKIAKQKKKIEKLEDDIADAKKDQLKYGAKANELKGEDLPDQYASKEELEKAIADHEKVVEALKKKLDSIK